MANVAELVVKISTDTKGAQGDLDATASKASKMGDGLKKAALPAAAALAGIGVAATKAVDAASKTQQAYGALDAIFGSNAAQMKKWAEGAATSVGLGKSEYAELASVIGAQLKNAGVPMDQIAKKTDAMIRQGGDLAATFGGTTAEAVGALSSALKGETDPIERYGVSIKQADIAARQAAEGTAELEGEAGKAAKTQALLGLVNDQTADSVGAFAKESESAAGAQQIASAQYENLMSTLGTVLLPVVSAVAGALGGLASVMENNAGIVQIVVGVIAGLAAAILLANVAISVYTTVTTIAGIVSAASWGAALLPILLVIAAVVAVTAVVVILWKKSETFRSVVTGVWNGVKSAVEFVGDAVGDVIDVVGRLITKIGQISVPGLIAAAFDAIRSAVEAAWNWVGNLIGRIGNISVPGIIREAFDNIKTAVDNAWTKVGDLIGAIGNISVPGTIKSAIDNITTSIGWLIGKVESLIGWLSRIKVPKIDLPGPLSVTPAPEGAGTVSTFATPRVPASRAGASSTVGPTIIVNGAIDPEATARQIRRILAGHDRRTGLA